VLARRQVVVDQRQRLSAPQVLDQRNGAVRGLDNRGTKELPIMHVNDREERSDAHVLAALQYTGRSQLRNDRRFIEERGERLKGSR
jgi:hypothetical protein